jgi:hypothetical protein
MSAPCTWPRHGPPKPFETTAGKNKDGVCSLLSQVPEETAGEASKSVHPAR